VLMIEMRNRRVRAGEDMVELLGVPLLGVIGPAAMRAGNLPLPKPLPRLQPSTI
jgi:hypothetical protein